MLTISDRAYKFLKIQQGALNKIESREEFERAYNEGLEILFDDIINFLPPNIKNSLDIGSGLGGIDILLQREFKHDVSLMDALNTQPICIRHDVPFNDIDVTVDFWHTNKADLTNYFWPGNFNKCAEKFDLILSIQSYCFHYSPDVYLDIVKKCCHDNTVLIFDVRNQRKEWLATLRNNFDEIAVISESEKFTRRLFKCKLF